MSIHFETSIDAGTLKVRTWGRDSSLEEVKRYGMTVFETCLDRGCNKLLLDERALKYELDILDTYKLAEFYSEQMVRLKQQVIKAAIVCDPKYLKDAVFWEDCSVNRGLFVKAFTSADDALLWLEED